MHGTGTQGWRSLAPAMALAVALGGCADAATAPDRPTASLGRGRGPVCTVEVVDLGTLGGATSRAHDVNLLGHIVGEAQTAGGDTHAVLWRRGEATDLGTLGGATSVAWAINDRGQVVGQSETIDGTVRAFLWQRGHMVDLATLAPELAQSGTVAHDINLRGQIVGRLGEFGFLLDHGVVTSLELPLYHDIVAYAINLKGAVAGALAGGPTDAGFVWTSAGGFEVVGQLGGTHGAAEDINLLGEVVGRSDVATDDAIHAFLVDRHGVTHDLGTLAPPGPFVHSAAHGINLFGQVVGETAAPGASSMAFLWWDGRMTALGTLPGHTVSTAAAINNRGQVVGWSGAAATARATRWTLRAPHSRACWAGARRGGAAAGDGAATPTV